ncbi:LRR domain containing protein [Trema orientale]|uniref:LRR domain containing protein n=1 Tax=Trema orientale TaxID=63057 RepID=A0A2P5E6D0_TREOI|nr:LRR domain containing protein [Trema orientale]
MRTHKGIGCLEKLQILGSVDAHHHRLDPVKELEMLRQLRWLTLSHLTAQSGHALCLSIQKMNHLELSCRLKNMPNWISKLQNLSTLGLNLSRLVDDPLKNLKALPNLEYLWLEQAFEGEELQFEEGTLHWVLSTVEILWLAVLGKPQTPIDFRHAKGICT